MKSFEWRVKFLRLHFSKSISDEHTSYKGKEVMTYLIITEGWVRAVNGEAGREVRDIFGARWTYWIQKTRKGKQSQRSLLRGLASSTHRHWNNKRLFFMRFDKVGFLQAEGKMLSVPVGSWKHRKNSNLLKHTPESIRTINTIKERKKFPPGDRCFKYLNKCLKHVF